MGMAAEALCWMADIAQVLVVTLIIIVLIGVFFQRPSSSALLPLLLQAGLPPVFVFGAHDFWV